jgi:hypothetical protein
VCQSVVPGWGIARRLAILMRVSLYSLSLHITSGSSGWHLPNVCTPLYQRLSGSSSLCPALHHSSSHTSSLVCPHQAFCWPHRPHQHQHTTCFPALLCDSWLQGMKTSSYAPLVSECCVTQTSLRVQPWKQQREWARPLL